MSNVTVRFKFGSALVGAVIGLEAGLYGVGELACGVLWPESKMCGLPAVFFGGSLGAIAGTVAGALIANRFGANLIAFGQRDTWIRNALLFAFAAFAGVWYISLLEGKGESFQLWYWLTIMPALCSVSAAIGYYAPRHAWRWGVAPLLGQWLWVVFEQRSQIGIGNLGPFAHVVVFAQYALSAIPCVIAAEIGAYLSHARSAHVTVRE